MCTDGSSATLSVREALGLADEIRSINGDIPLQRFTLTRLLIAILYGAFGHEFTVEQWRYMLDGGASNPAIRERLHEYCDRVHDRFDLFDEHQPFYQVAGLHTAKHEMSGLERLILDVPSGEPFFTTRIGEGLQSVQADEAARWLVTVQAFDSSGIKSGAVGDPRVKGGKGYPIGVAWDGHLGGFLVEGSTLWQTLMLNYVSYEVLSAAQDSIDWDDDIPVWERPASDASPAEGFDQPSDFTGDTSFFHGPATLMTWQSRRMLLKRHGETVTGVLVCNGDRLKPQNAHGFETMTAWRRSPAQEKALKRPLVYMPRKHDPSRELWRGLPILTTGAAKGESKDHAESIRPMTLQWLARVCKDEERLMPIRLHAFGIEYGAQEAVVDCDVDDTLDLDLTVLTADDPQLGNMLQKAVNDTDEGIRALRQFAANIALAEGLPTDAPRQRAAELGYSQFDTVFRQWVRGITGESDMRQLSDDWHRIARRTLLHLGERLAAEASPRAIVGRTVDVNGKEQHYSVAGAEIWYRGKVSKLFPNEEG